MHGRTDRNIDRRERPGFTFVRQRTPARARRSDENSVLPFAADGRPPAKTVAINGTGGTHSRPTARRAAKYPKGDAAGHGNNISETPETAATEAGIDDSSSLPRLCRVFLQSIHCMKRRFKDDTCTFVDKGKGLCPLTFPKIEDPTNEYVPY